MEGPSNDYVARGLKEAFAKGPLSPEEESKLINQLYFMKIWDAPNVSCLTYRLLAEVHSLREA